MLIDSQGKRERERLTRIGTKEESLSETMWKDGIELHQIELNFPSNKL